MQQRPRAKDPMNKRNLTVSLGLIGAAGVGVGIILLLTSSPSHRTVNVAPVAAVKRAVKIDPAQAKGAFEAQAAKYRQAGEPTRPQDLAPAPVSPDRNAAAPFAQAVAVLDAFEVPANRPFFNLNVRLAMPQDRWKLVNDALDIPLAPLLAKVDEATTRPACV